MSAPFNHSVYACYSLRSKRLLSIICELCWKCAVWVGQPIALVLPLRVPLVWFQLQADRLSFVIQIGGFKLFRVLVHV